ncbi:hypothetical protein CVT26_013182 [Gymnopilus dilepis]|uniref:MYND-type domain-containing protein n=1 Tax=Gymnopilus dilepis TaxID=231916 RepID=A0A409YFI7_9AGAR|nr:hypothetical protein CVT26_013182 [Gymnopilus dilepis]
MAYWRMSLRDKEYFPNFNDLPQDHDISVRPFTSPDYYGISQVPLKHWCLLVEIVEEVWWPARRMWQVKDKDGKQFLFACYFDTNVELPRSWEKNCKVGGVIAIMYALRHMFMDGQVGIRAEELQNITMLPCSLDTLLSIGDKLSGPPSVPTENVCASCNQLAGLKCSRCSVTKYCGNECQLDDWKRRHKQECIAVRQITEWKKRDWTDFEEYWVDWIAT